MNRDLLLAHTYIWLEVVYAALCEALKSGDTYRIITAEHIYCVASENYLTIGGILPEITV
jgi:hypothetical protein